MDKSLLNRATSTDDTPTPGYLYGEIARMTLQGHDSSEKLADYLASRLKKKHHNTKYKTLQVIRHTCREGRGDFRKEMQRHLLIVKDCLQFRGPPDPLKGDEINKRVRDSAKDCLDAIFEMGNPSSGYTQNSRGMASRIQGVGSAPDTCQPSGSKWSFSRKAGNSESNLNYPPSQYVGPTHSTEIHRDNLPPAFHDGGNTSVGYGGATGGYNPNAGGYNPNAGGYNPNAGGYNPNAGGYNPTAGEYNPNAGGYHPNPTNGPTTNIPNLSSGYNPNGGYGGNERTYGASSSRMQGIGNPSFQDTRASDSKGFLQGLKEKAVSTFSRPDLKPTFAGPPPGAQHAPDGWSFATNRGPSAGSYNLSAVASGSYNPDFDAQRFEHGYGAPVGQENAASRSHLTEKAYTGPRKKGTVGGAWAGDGEDSSEENGSDSTSIPAASPSSYSSFGQMASLNDPRNFPNESQQFRATGQTSGATSDGNYERNLLSSLCTSAGMRASPPKDKMDEFFKNAITLDPEIVGAILNEFIENSVWQTQSKALLLVDGLLATPGCEGFFDYFIENANEIQLCRNAEKSVVRDRATKVLRTLGIIEADSSIRKTKENTKKTPNMDLLGDFEDQAPNIPNIEPDSNASIFEGLTTKSVVDTPAYPNNTNTSSNAVNEMFSGLVIGNTNTIHQSSPLSTIPPVSINLDPLLQPVSTPPFQHYQPYRVPPSNPIGMVMNPPLINKSYVPAQSMQNNMSPFQMTQGVGSVMQPRNIAKTIAEPSSIEGFGFMQKKSEDSFNFVKEEMKKS